MTMTDAPFCRVYRAYRATCMRDPATGVLYPIHAGQEALIEDGLPVPKFMIPIHDRPNEPTGAA
jgi:hypothetical protein